MTRFIDNWNKVESKSLKHKLGGIIVPNKPLKPMIEQAIRQIRAQIAKLDLACARIRERGLKIFNNVVLSIQRRDMQRASMFANELSEVRRMNKMITQSKLALEQIVLRLDTVKDLGDITSTIGPTIPVIRNIKSGLASVVPEAENGMREISHLLNEVIVNASQTDEERMSFEVLNEDAERILAEASAIAEEQMKEIFPEIPQLLSKKVEERLSEAI
ncbi:MAG: Snf7 family protein [Candidatus Methylarchaceae archaeon HK01B]|nr:Snf7 family protein [Candidatus Methylarchaceae archaeon HK01M]MCP8318380.1 Snf7 family protein [Candidatus Methylarchaceae archaeon HK01B]